MTLSVGILVVLALFPIALAALFLASNETLPRLAIWFSAGHLMSQWMHVMLFVFFDRQAGKQQPTLLNVAYFFHVPWWQVLVGGVLISIGVGIALFILIANPDDIRLRWVLVAVGLGLAASQLAGSSVPKLSGEIAMVLFLLCGLLINRYFLTYSPDSKPEAHQLQSDALTSFGLLVVVISLWWPLALGFGKFLFESYFAEQPIMRQYQMTRYAGYVGWLLTGIGLLGWRCLEVLIRARGGHP